MLGSSCCHGCHTLAYIGLCVRAPGVYIRSTETTSSLPRYPASPASSTTRYLDNCRWSHASHPRLMAQKRRMIGWVLRVKQGLCIYGEKTNQNDNGTLHPASCTNKRCDHGNDDSQSRPLGTRRSNIRLPHSPRKKTNAPRSRIPHSN